jgi:hypothetical protein
MGMSMGFFNGKDEPEHGFTVEDLQADAARKMAVLRAMAAEFVEENDKEPLTRKQICAATRTPLAYLEKSAALSETAPEIAAPPRAAEILRLTHAANVIYGPVLEEAERLARQIRVAMWRKNLAAGSIARTVHRLAGLLVETEAGQWLRTHVDQLQRIPGRPWRRKPRQS